MAKQTILIVEDENEIAEIERDYLEKSGFSVLIAEDGKKGLEMFEENDIDLVILDINLPFIEGLEVCQKIRVKSGVPIIMVTAKTKEIDELIGFESGADDYIKKPFSPRVLVHRVKTLLKRPEMIQDDNEFKIGDLILNRDKMSVTKLGKVLDLTTVQFNILFTMAQNKGKVYTRDEIMDSGYPEHLPPDIYDRTIDSHIKNIRKLIEKDTKNPGYVLTVRGVGYKVSEKV